MFRDQLVTLADLEEFKRDLLLSIKQLFTENKSAGGKKWLKSYEVREVLRISSGTLQSLRNSGTLPFTKIGGIIYYDLDNINKLLIDMQKRSLHNLTGRETF
ncbi:MAG: DNA-binding protein [Chitinophagaceae bacterium]|nr:MAG: DNA-binding protein [Chitinophagaceae bacterium]